jgi:hypothetical protein
MTSPRRPGRRRVRRLLVLVAVVGGAVAYRNRQLAQNAPPMNRDGRT